jgi:hypothetical protein
VALTTGQPWLFHSSRTCVVTFTGIEYASRPNQAIDGRGLSPHKTRSLVGCSTVGFPESGWQPSLVPTGPSHTSRGSNARPYTPREGVVILVARRPVWLPP